MGKKAERKPWNDMHLRLDRVTYELPYLANLQYIDLIGDLSYTLNSCDFLRAVKAWDKTELLKDALEDLERYLDGTVICPGHTAHEALRELHKTKEYPWLSFGQIDGTIAIGYLQSRRRGNYRVRVEGTDDAFWVFHDYLHSTRDCHGADMNVSWITEVERYGETLEIMDHYKTTIRPHTLMTLIEAVKVFAKGKVDMWYLVSRLERYLPRKIVDDAVEVYDLLEQIYPVNSNYDSMEISHKRKNILDEFGTTVVEGLPEFKQYLENEKQQYE